MCCEVLTISKVLDLRAFTTVSNIAINITAMINADLHAAECNLKALFLVAVFPSMERVSNACIIRTKCSLNTLMHLCCSNHLVWHRLRMFGINFLLKTDSRKNVILSFIVPTVLRISDIVFKSFTTKFCLCEEQ